MQTYSEMRNAFMKKYNEFSSKNIIWAFGCNLTLEKILKDNNLPLDTKVVSLPGGGLLLKDKEKEFNELFDSYNKELKERMSTDKIFAIDAFEWELNNHEYGYTKDLTPACEALGITIDDLNSNKILAEALTIASDNIIRFCEMRGI